MTLEEFKVFAKIICAGNPKLSLEQGACGAWFIGLRSGGWSYYAYDPSGYWMKSLIESRSDIVGIQINRPLPNQVYQWGNPVNFDVHEDWESKWIYMPEPE